MYLGQNAIKSLAALIELAEILIPRVTMIKPMAPSFFSRKSRERKVRKAPFLAGSVSEDDRVLVDISTYNESVDRARRKSRPQ